MGYSRWTAASYQTYADTTSYRSMSREELFSNRRLLDELNPAKVTIRESRDSAANPQSTPIIFALDVTGSMDVYAERIAKDVLPAMMSTILDSKPVTDPHIMFMGIDDVHARSPAALQVSQFEPDVRILDQLQKMWMVCQGGGNDSESYDLAWVFADRKTALDINSRGKKGFLFTMGDECAPFQTVTEDQLRHVFGPGEYANTSPRQSLARAQEKFNVFHLVIEQGSYARSSLDRVRKTWTELLGNRVLFVRDFEDVAKIVAAAMELEEGGSVASVVERDTSGALRYAFRNLLGSGI